VIASAATVYLAPLVMMLVLTPRIETVHSAGVLRPQPGQTIVTEPSALKAPDNVLLLTTERLNNHVATIVLANPGQATMLKASDESTIDAILVRSASAALGDRVAKDLETARKGGSKWDPAAGPWGVFLLPSDIPPESTEKTFGLVVVRKGIEATRMETETIINRRLFELSQNKHWQGPNTPRTLWELMEATCAEGLMEPEDALETLAFGQMLGITLIPSKGLFLSEETNKNWEKLDRTLAKLPNGIKD
jgi:hypothetical protein